MPGTMITVQMGQMAVTTDPEDTLVSFGLGSCIGLILIDRRKQVAGLAHVMLPDSTAAVAGGEPGKFADTAVPELLDKVVAAGGRKVMLDVVLVGGAKMFSLDTAKNGSLDIGQRNEAAVREALGRARLSVRAAETSGDRGRTVRVHVGDGAVAVKEAGGTDHVIFGAREASAA